MKPNNERLAKIVREAKSKSLENIEKAKEAITPLLKQVSDKMEEIQEILEKYNCYSSQLEEICEKIDEIDMAIFRFDLPSGDDIKNIQTKWDSEIPFGQ